MKLCGAKKWAWTIEDPENVRVVRDVGALTMRTIAILPISAMIWIFSLASANASPSALTAISANQAGPNAAKVILSFASAAPQFRLAGAGAYAVVVDLFNAAPLSTVARVLGSAGPIASARYEQFGANGRLTIQLRSALPIRANAVGKDIVLDVGLSRSAATAPSSVASSKSDARESVRASVKELVRLKYADISEIVGILVSGQSIASNDTFVPQPSQLGQTVPTFGGGYGATGSPPLQQQLGMAPSPPGGAQSLGQRINENIAVDRRLNAVILSGPMEVVADLRSMIERLDVPLRTVLLETQIVELTDNAAKAVGIDYANNTQLGAVALQSRSFQQPAISLNLQAAIYDVVSRGGGKLLARPSIVAQDGASASILTGDAIPIVTNVTSFGASTVTQQQVQYIQVGVNLQIQPRVSTDGYVTSHLFSQVSSVTGYVQGFPQISQRIATTSTTVHDGESFVIGGLIQDNELHSLERIPGISSLPIIGGLFRNRRESRTATNLYIVVTPRIVKLSTAP